MKLAAVTTVRNECDIIEAFVRHHCEHFNKLIVLDDGSSDGTYEVLRSLQAAGAPVVLLREPTVGYEQSRYMTLLLRMRLPVGSVAVVVFILVSAPQGWDQRGSALRLSVCCEGTERLRAGP